MWGNNSDNTALSAIPDNGGSGFQLWTSSESGGVAAGYFTGDSTEFGGGNVNSADNLAWGMYGGVGGIARAFRKTVNPLVEGGSLRVKCGIRFRNGFKGVGFLANGTRNLMFQATANEYQYSINGGASWTNLGWDYGTGTSIFEVAIYLTNIGGSDYTHNWKIIQLNTAVSINGSFNISAPVDEAEFFVGETDGTGNDNLYVNFLSAFNPYRLS